MEATIDQIVFLVFWWIEAGNTGLLFLDKSLFKYLQTVDVEMQQKTQSVELKQLY